MWHGVSPAATTQFAADSSVDLDATQRVQTALVDDGVDGLVLLGTVGENNSLLPDEKRAVLRGAVEALGGRVPLITGVSELGTDRAVQYAKDAEAIGMNALMVLPAMVYVPTSEELAAHLKAVAEATSLPVMLYNNPPAYRVTIDFDTLEKLAAIPNIVAIKESAPDSRRITDVINRFGDRYTIMAGLDDVALEAMLLGASAAFERGDLEEARRIYRWFMPLLHLDSDPDLVQSIKLAEQIMGRGSERVRMPRLPLSGARRAEVIAMVEKCAATRPTLTRAAA